VFEGEADVRLRRRAGCEHGEARVIVWFTGLPASGKSTLARAVQRSVAGQGQPVCVLDGDSLRSGLNRDLGFTPADREENVRRVGEVAKLFLEAGGIVLVAVIAPYRNGRDRSRSLVKPGQFMEVWCKCPLAVCEQRDPKGMYRKARAGTISDFTGVSAPYEDPLHPELVIETDRLSLEESVEKVLEYLAEREVIQRVL
jgi:adenylylsulfate kinase